jgi:hypothetical protein
VLKKEKMCLRRREVVSEGEKGRREGVSGGEKVYMEKRVASGGNKAFKEESRCLSRRAGE